MNIIFNHKHDIHIDPCCKNFISIRSEQLSAVRQIILNFTDNSSRSVWRITLNSQSGTCSVKKLSRGKKPHPNRLTRTDARAAQLLKKLIQTKIPRVVFFRAARDNEWTLMTFVTRSTTEFQGSTKLAKCV